MNPFIPYFTTFITVLALTPLAGRLGRRFSLWDYPDRLGIHDAPTPRSGGIAIFLGLMAGLAVLYFSSFGLLNSGLFWSWSVGLAASFAVGLLDDLHEIKPSAKALGLLAAAGVSMALFPGGLTAWRWLDILAGVIVLNGSANALNFLDGMDGLAAGVVFIAALGLAGLFHLAGLAAARPYAVMLAGASLGFWFHNRPRARIFMGDCGSLMLGFGLGLLLLFGWAAGTRYLLASVLILSLPVLDTGLAIVRRVLGKKDIFTGDRRHVYDLLLKNGLSAWRVNLAMYALGLLFGLLGLASVLVPLGLAALGLLAAWALFILWMMRLGMFSLQAENSKLKAESTQPKV
jgi:UDP-GlcNAc:undecaprenyl-phosphate/decaprenyl-phosphate GlcNAc-1-phosphate transferase